VRPDEYRGIILGLLGKHRSEGTIPKDGEGYFNGHWPRFETHLEMWRNDIPPGEVNTVLDFGTEFPFSSLWWNLTRGSWVQFCGADPGGRDVSPFARFTQINLCHKPDGWPRADLVICTECLEHLPVPILSVMEWLKQRALKYLFLSFPCGGQNARDYEKDFSESHSPEAIHSLHIREYTDETARALVDSLGMEIEDIRNSSQPAYGAPIMNVLLRRAD
jgi:hypothetical protein